MAGVGISASTRGSELVSRVHAFNCLYVDWINLLDSSWDKIRRPAHWAAGDGRAKRMLASRRFVRAAGASLAATITSTAPPSAACSQDPAHPVRPYPNSNPEKRWRDKAVGRVRTSIT